jgi:type IV secretion system protein VirB8
MSNRSPSESERAGAKAMEQFFNWDYDVYQHQRRSTRIAWAVASLACFVALAAVFAVASLAPLKSVEPIFVRVDNATGTIDVLNRIDEESTVSRQDLVNKGYLARYVRAREGYFNPIIKQQYRRVMLMSAGRAKTECEQEMSKENTQSPLNKYTPQDRIDVQINAITFLDKGLAQVRFTLDIEDKNGARTRHYIATIKYRYDTETEVPLSVLEDNALGFEVTEYKSEQEDGQ